MKTTHIVAVLSAFTLMVGCRSSQSVLPVRMGQPIQYHSLVIVEAQFTYSDDHTLLTARIKETEGSVTLYKTIRQPLNGNQVKAETRVLQNDQEVEKHDTTPSEAKLVLKVAANHGLADVYKDLKERYRLAGLTP